MVNYQYRHTDSLYQRGFTLIELLVTVAVLGIIASIALPSFSKQIVNKSLESTASMVEESLKTAISESAIRRQPITFNIDTSNQTISLEDKDANTLNTYSFASNQSITLSTGAPTTFKIGPGKKTRNSANTDSVTMTFTICSNQIDDEKGQLVSINALAQVRKSASGSCS